MSHKYKTHYLSDASSPHTHQADQAVPLGPIDSPQGNPHQNIDLLIRIALEHGADAIHPGYGYLSENADFSQRIQDAGLIFLGPSPHSMAVLGDKRSAKQYLLKNAPQIPLVPGYNGPEQTIERLSLEADRIGFPVLIKASAGGGGKGMRIVYEKERLADELSRAQSEAQRSFGSSDCILEKYIERSKHIEIQILGDAHGNVVSLSDRECSIQRRHQKIIEEAPSPWLSADLRKEMNKKAIDIGKLLNYESAGTVEFIVDVKAAKFYFLEVNTRIQVEHPITEETSGLDIVGLQIYVAGGGRLDDTGYFTNGVAPQVGHAIECRLCAEDPYRDFVPDVGVIRRWTPASKILPASRSEYARFETGIETGSQISIYFDSLIAKVVVWAPTRSLAIAKMVEMLSHSVCIGIRTNQLFLQSCLMQSGFHDPEYSTSFIPEFMTALVKNPHIESLPKTQELLALFPSLLDRQLKSQNRPRAAFSGIQGGFRNQKSDLAATQADIVQIPTQSNKGMIISWPPQTSTTDGFQAVHMLSLALDHEGSGKGEMKPSIQLARQYNKLSSQLRAMKASPEGLYARVKLEVAKSTKAVFSPTQIWHLDDLLLSVDSKRYSIYTARESKPAGYDAGVPQRVYAHVPQLGTHIEYHLHTLLSYGESLRARSSAAGDSQEEKNPKAPMPCKVLRVLKQDGDRVKVGEIAMVVESMKMEMNILASADGTFKSMFQKDEAVDEGAVLFTIK